MTEFIPYCGSAPVPGSAVWKLDPVLGASLLVGLALSFRLLQTASHNRTQAACLLSGWSVLALALMSPLCNLSVALFAARAAQHLLIVFVVAPLIALSGVPARAFDGVCRIAGWGGGVASAALFLAPFCFAPIFWFWHFGGPYDSSLQNNQVYWMMQLSIIFASVALWASLLDPTSIRTLSFLTAGVFTGFQMSLLGALLTLSGTPWFSAHEATTWPWGLNSLEDQQFGGALMWTAGGIFLAGFLLFSLARALKTMEPKAYAPSVR
jgi:putative membrane protein